MSEWIEYKLGECVTVLNGYAFKSSDFKNTQLKDFLPVIKIKNVANGDVTLNDVQYHHYSEEYNNYVLSKGDILIALTGNHSEAKTQVVGGVSLYKLNKKALLNQRVAKIIPHTNIVNEKYLYYLMKEDNFHMNIASKESGSASQANISKKDIEEMVILLPSLTKQDEIASILSSLDDKIDLLNRENATLEAMAETLFRQWFIEEAKEDWEEGKLGDYVEIVNGVSYKGEDLQPSEVGMVTLKSFGRNGGFRLDGYKDFCGKYKDTQKLNTGDMVVAHTDITQDAAVIGNPAIVFADERYRVITFSMDVVKVISTTPLISISTLYFLMKSSTFKDHCLGYANGSTVLHLSKKAIPEYEFIIPPKDVINRFNEVASSIVNRVLHNNKQIQTLIHTRDGLLPKLMSNKISI